MRIRTATGLIAIMAALMAPQALAGEMHPEPPQSGQWEQPVIDPYSEATKLGRTTLRREVTCRTCLFPDGVKDRETAMSVIAKMQSGELVLPEDKQLSLVHYLDRKYDLRSRN